MPVITTIADSVVALLQAGLDEHAFIHTPGDVPVYWNFTPTRVWVPEFTVEELQTLHVSVVPVTFTQDLLTRGLNQEDRIIQVAIQKKIMDVDPDKPVDATATALVDPLIGLTEQIGDYVRSPNPDRRTLACSPRGVLTKIESALGAGVPYAVAHLRTKGVFTAVLALTYQTYR